jgi:energy-coupling factor transporter ATP-binding protein EcfA2
MYDKHELRAMSHGRIKKLAIAKAKQNGDKRSWIQTTPKDALITYILTGEHPSWTPSAGTPSPNPTTSESSKVKITPKPKADGLESMITNMVLEQIGDTIEEGVGKAIEGTESALLETFMEETTKITERVDKKIATLQRPVKVYINDVEVEKVDGLKHKQFSKVLKCLKLFKRVWLMGPSGTGKSHLIEQCANALGFSKEDGTYEYVKGSCGVTESHLTGRMTFDGTFIDGSVARSFRNGTFLSLDEFDGFDANCGLVFNSVFDNQGILSTPNDKDNPFVLKNDGFNVAVASNTTGDGSDFEYVGRGQLDLATLDRLCNETSVRKIVSTRLFIDGQIWRLSGESNAGFIDTITEGWTKQECDKVDIKKLKTDHKGV